MGYSRNYARVFVTLKQDCPDYCLNLREAMGRCIIEVRLGKGKFMAYVQGIRKGTYNICLVSCVNGNSKGVIIGDIKVDDSGKGEFKKLFDPDNVENTGIKIEDFHVVAVAVQSDEKKFYPLCGYMSSSVSWKDNFTYFGAYSLEETSVGSAESDDDENIVLEETEEEVISVAEESANEEIVGQNTEATENGNEDTKQTEENDNTGDFEKDISVSVEEDAQHVEKFAFESVDKSNENFRNVVSKFKKELEQLESEVSVTKNVERESVKSEKSDEDFFGLGHIFRCNTKMKPFQKQKKDIEWVRIGSGELVLLPGRMWIYLNNPFVCCAERRYRHLILGRYEEQQQKKYLFGVPGVYFSDYRLEAGLQGFRQFKCCSDKAPLEGDYGYWILHIEEGVN